MMEHRGIPARLLEAKTHGVNPVVYGEIKVPGAKRTLLLYAHYDGQPVNPSEWAPGLEPFSPKFILYVLYKPPTGQAHRTASNCRWSRKVAPVHPVSEMRTLLHPAGEWLLPGFVCPWPSFAASSVLKPQPQQRNLGLLPLQSSTEEQSYVHGNQVIQ